MLTARRLCVLRIAKVAKEKIEEFDVAVVRPMGHHGRSGSADASRGENVPDHYYQCVLVPQLCCTTSVNVTPAACCCSGEEEQGTTGAAWTG